MVSALASVPFVIANSYAAYIANTSPTPPPDISEQNRFREQRATRDVLSYITPFTVPVLFTVQVMFCMSEVYMITSTVYPSLQVPFLHQILLPYPAKAPSASTFHLTPSFVLVSTLLYAGTILRALCYRALGRHFTFELAIKKEHKLVTDGPYSFVRHPSYLGEILVFLGMVLAQLFNPGTWWTECGMWETRQGQAFGYFWVVFTSSVLWMILSRVPKEDLMMRMQFGEEWMSWSKRTPYAVIPYVW
ncbi:hypothetical protein EIP91_000428 [Steccherinum ochraceum]|uniref:Protein-S-isoprenylcysteine O-methyltransferase n=1 Tax=Steccherinum ochraceum TaxID=92696 RepID=A0A4R0RWB0_9APHY|nr:hypothetical protein EIP91_000428 [Steccherinum ochraceum]